MQRDKKSKKVRLRRADDGTVIIPQDKDQELGDLWSFQKTTIEIPKIDLRRSANRLTKKFQNFAIKNTSLGARGRSLTDTHPQESRRGSMHLRRDDDEKTVVIDTATRQPVSVLHKSSVITKKKVQKFDAIASGRTHHSKNAQQQAETTSATFSFSVTMPSFRSPRNLSRRGKKRLMLMSLAAVLVLVAGLSLMANRYRSDSEKSGATKAVNSEVAGAIQTKVKPEIPVLSPNGEGVDAMGGFAKISPEGKPPVYAYIDTIAGVPVKISQQQLPDSMISDPTKITEVAKQFYANNELEVGDLKAYIGKSIKGPQSVVYAKGTTLVLIVSDSEVPNKNWIEYISSLQY